MNKIILHNDEPTNIDKLDRSQYAEALARIAEICETPMVIGLYGSWGIGKTSLMKLIEAKLDPQKTHVAWFDPWQHQFDESPALALLHTIVDTFDMKEEGKKLLTVIAAAFGSMLLKATTTLSIKDIDELGKRFEEERFMVREARVRLHKHFKELIEKAQKAHGGEERRIIFFIDDLDRCMPAQILSMLESLKLYFNLPRCVYFLGADRQALERSIKHHYKDIELNEASYLDKIVQLPFTIPPIAPKSMEQFIAPLLSEKLKPCQSMLVKGLGDNPRQVKRFINTLTLNHQLASSLNIPDYNIKVLALLFLIQYRNFDLYSGIVNKPDLLLDLINETDETKTLRDEYMGRGMRLKDVLKILHIPKNIQPEQYIYLTKLTVVKEEAKVKEDIIQLKFVLLLHKMWLATNSKEGEQANLRGADLAGVDLRNSDLRMANLGVANLAGAKIINSDLRGANLAGANLAGANLIETDMRRVKLSKANLHNALLMGSNLAEANLSNADITGANLLDSNITLSQLKSAIIDEYTELPEHLKKD